MLIVPNFDSFPIPNPIVFLYKKVASKISFSNRGCACFFATRKAPGTSFQVVAF